ncbi:hypothetical protein PXK58_02005 [Phaeobacter gallaeciensis]|uniref:hypothetical protein n=1 Tax=Phaeobacter gallaeciensis TaxID=60890 RepID=UPI0023801060|nr:hypothetical protein [Phaeobacter gallaeciensis]MDE4272736.1 hypothetical protein [Phaeobacter gallaeciensis]MDE4298311.1 hypothetical protein [Phaeobacter gallaeciensis]MDE5183499.1 hypothetical protein [Phaeobacter gallaeciensis]
MTENVVAKLATVAVMQAQYLADQIREIVVPLLPTAKRAFAESIARRIERGPIFEDAVLRDLMTFKSILTARIETGTHRFWHGDENHSRGGYESVYREDDACKLADAVAELALLCDMTLATLSAVGAVRQVEALIDG